MNEPTALPSIQIPAATPQERIAKAIEKPNAFAKPASLKGQEKGTRFRPLLVKEKGRKRQRIKKRDPRLVKFY